MSSSTSNRAAAIKRKNVKVADKFRAACPPHKVKDLEQLVKALKGDEEAIRAQIQEWWDEPEQPAEAEWEEINKRKPKKLQQSAGAGGGSAAPSNGGSSSGRGGGGRPSKRGAAGPRDAGRGGRGGPSRKGPSAGRGAGGRGAPRAVEGTQEQPTAEKDVDTISKPPEEESSPISVVETTGFVSARDPMPSGKIAPPTVVPSATAVTGNVWAIKGSAHLIEAEKPRPVPAVAQPKAQKAAPKRPPARQPQHQPIEVEETDSGAVPESKGSGAPEESTPILPEAPAPVWGKVLDASPAKKTDLASPIVASVMETASSPLKPQPVEEPEAVVEETVTPPTKSAPEVQPSINLGRWDVTEGEQARGLDFGYESFGPEETKEPAQAAAPAATSLSHVLPETTATKKTDTATPLSPARPPPGLGIPTSSMPPMPANAVLVHELEGKLERASLDAVAKVEEAKQVVVDVSPAEVAPLPAPQSINVAKVPAEKPVPSAVAPSQPLPPPPAATPDMSSLGGAPGISSAPGMPQHSAMSQNYPSYAPTMPSMYNYSANLGGAFVGIPALGVIPPQQQQQQQKLQQQGTQQSLHAPGLYGSSVSGVSGNEPAKQDETSDLPVSSATGATGSLNAMGGPPGMYAGMAYNPALAFYGQQHAYAPQMGQPHGGVGYGAYGYGAAHQFGGAPSGYGYQQLAMGQSGGYGQPYDPQAAETQHLNLAQQTSHHTTSSAYQKNTSGYRGRSTHHAQSPSHQYQNQYTPQHGLGYGAAQPYGAMGYNSMDHFQARAGYGPAAGAMNNPYGMQQASAYGQGIGPSSGISGFVGGHDDPNDRSHAAKGKGSKGGGIPRNTGAFAGNNSNVQQFQQVGSQGQPFGAQPGDHGSSTNSAGWGNQSWGGHTWQQGGGN